MASKHSHAVLHLGSSPSAASVTARKVGGPGLAFGYRSPAVYRANTVAVSQEVIGNKRTPPKSMQPGAARAFHHGRAAGRARIHAHLLERCR